MKLDGLRITERGMRKLADRGIREWEPFEVFFNRHVMIRNKRNRAASHRMIGRTDSGTLLTLLIRESQDAGTWDVVNGWRASSGEHSIYQRRAR